MTERMCAPARVIAATLGVPGPRLRVWAHRYGIRRYDHDGQVCYDLLDVARIKAATREERERRRARDKPRERV